MGHPAENKELVINSQREREREREAWGGGWRRGKERKTEGEKRTDREEEDSEREERNSDTLIERKKD